MRRAADQRLRAFGLNVVCVRGRKVDDFAVIVDNFDSHVLMPAANAERDIDRGVQIGRKDVETFEYRAFKTRRDLITHVLPSACDASGVACCTAGD